MVLCTELVTKRLRHTDVFWVCIHADYVLVVPSLKQPRLVPSRRPCFGWSRCSPEKRPDHRCRCGHLSCSWRHCCLFQHPRQGQLAAGDHPLVLPLPAAADDAHLDDVVERIVFLESRVVIFYYCRRCYQQKRVCWCCCFVVVVEVVFVVAAYLAVSVDDADAD